MRPLPSSSLSLFLILSFIIMFWTCKINAAAIDTPSSPITSSLPTVDPCPTDIHQQRLFYDDGMTGYSSKGCQEACAAQSSNGDDSNGMCVMDECYCTDVGIGDCRDNNHEGCDAICQQLSLDWIGVCSNGGCHCLY
ncbi:uncharacterized protein BX664DRAFT_334152 [Halteromyces radiatus]|uniref:uncharacterized protein n=1 Tax=Halteromyces radiatus TaxID=101107 RepID=UPI00221F8F24|nr:uncharacterized protein BX664DRAFT_334152 [Halteromyces radiatus]KAI8089885.1 hypothetical protein BX664DRAFT_334152 [Halteromyces radiatus]